MANKKILCPKCRRSYDNTIEYCPYCSTPNPLLSGADKLKDEGNLFSNNKPKVKRAAEKIIDVDEPTVIPSEPVVSNEYDDNEEGYSQDEYDDGEYSDEAMDDGDEEYYEEGEYDEMSDGEDEPGYYEEDGDEGEEYEEYDDNTENDSSSGSDISLDSKRSKIDWSDEKKKETVDISKAYNDKGEYDPNYDGYYEDTKPRIENELDNLAVGRDKAIIKGVLTVAAIAGIIVYLILTL